MEQPRIRVLHIITRLILGGAQENTLWTVVGQQRSKRYDVVLLSGIDEGPEGTLHDVARTEGVNLVLTRWLVRPINPVKDLIALLSLYRFIKRGRFDIVHTHSSKAGILGRVAARLAGVPVVVHTLHSLVFHEFQSEFKNRLYIWLKKWCAPLTDCYISVCDAVTKGALKEGISSPHKYVTIYSGINLKPFVDIGTQLTPEEAKAQLSLDPARPVVGKVARLYHQKGHDLFIRAAARIAERDPAILFLLVGDGILRGPLEAMTKDLGIESQVVFAGRVDPSRIPLYMRAMDVLVHTSVREGVARVLPQAYATGTPVVAFNLDGAPEVIADGQTGFLVEPGSVEGIAKGVTTLLESASLRGEMGQRGRDIVMGKFPVEVMVERIDSMYSMLLAEKGVSARGLSFTRSAGPVGRASSHP
jgi:glycosyltransferase involved in cell wall biosynthesis